MKITVINKFWTMLLYFLTLIIIFVALLLFARWLTILGPKVLANFDWAYRYQIISTIPIFIPSLVGYLLLRIVNFFLFKKNTVISLMKATSKSLCKIPHKALAGMVLFLSAFLASFMVFGVYYTFAYLFGWTTMNVYPTSNWYFLDKLVDCFFISIREEFLFRFLLMSTIAYGINLATSKNISIPISLFITSLLFAIPHFLGGQEGGFSLSLFLLAMTAGVVLGLAYILTKSLFFSLGFHFGWDFFFGTIPIVGKFSTSNAPGWSSILTILIILVIMTSIYFGSRNLLKHETHWLW